MRECFFPVRNRFILALPPQGRRGLTVPRRKGQVAHEKEAWKRRGQRRERGRKEAMAPF